MPQIGKQLDKILVEIENVIIESEIHGDKPNYTENGFRAIIKLFMSASLDKMFDLQMSEKIPKENAEQMAFEFGDKLHKLIKIYTGFDTKKMYNEKH